MSSISPHELKVIKKSISKVAKGREVVATCIYGSRVAGYNRPDSDIDLLVVLQNYPYVVKYIYFSESSAKVSALAVDREALLRDAKPSRRWRRGSRSQVGERAGADRGLG